MEELIITYKVYVKTDYRDVITAINSSAFLTDLTSWIEIDEGTGDKYHHAQGHYLPLGLMTEDGIYQYKYVDGTVQERTADEIQADRDAIPPAPQVMSAAEMTAILNALTDGVGVNG